VVQGIDVGGINLEHGNEGGGKLKISRAGEEFR